MKNFFGKLLIAILVCVLLFIVVHDRMGVGANLKLPAFLGGQGGDAKPSQLLGDLLHDSEATDGEAGLVAESFLRALNAGDRVKASEYMAEGTLLPASFSPTTQNGLLLYEAVASRPQFEPVGELKREGNTATLQVRLYTPDAEGLRESLAVALQGGLDDSLARAARTEEVVEIGDTLTVRSDVLAALQDEAFAAVLSSPLPDTERGIWPLGLVRGEDGWRVSDCTALLGAAQGTDTDALAAELLADAAAKLNVTRKRYALPLYAAEGVAPDPACFGETDNPQVILDLLARPEARDLLAGRELIWSADTELFPDSVIRYYLDETILVIVWQEVASWACGTYAEVVVGDGSQFCRKLAEDDFDSTALFTPTQFAEQTKAVLTLSADFYRSPGRENGICVYQGVVRRFEPETSDCCFVTESGELLFVKPGQFATREEAQAFVDENRVSFSVCMGPVIVEAGQDVTPERYYWGDIYGQQARAALGVKDERHYLACVINGKAPGYYHPPQLFAAADAMVAHGVQRAYALDYGQSATVVLGTELINVVQYGEERAMSDVIFFASALPPATEAAG